MFKTFINSDKYLPRFHVSITVSLTVSALNSASKSLGSRPDWVIVLHSCILRQDKLFSQCLSLTRSINGYQRILRGAWWNIRGGGGWKRGVALQRIGIPTQGGVVILLLASCYGNRNKLRLKSYMARVQSLPFAHLYLSLMKSLQNWYQSSIIDGVEGRQVSKCQRECQKVFEKIIQRYESLTDNSYLRSPVTVCYFRSRRVYGSTMGHSPSGYKLSRHLWCQSSHVIS